MDMLGPFLPLPGQGDTGKVLITSYEMIIRDAKYLRRCAWEFVILDEGPPTLLIMNEGAPLSRTHAAPTLPSPCPYAARSSSPHTMPHPIGPPRPLTH